ncbi:hypothetical protein AB0F52_25645 [Amycolatopsis sp. NPDC024027]|uniref:hypothetical protein n=1 Tax=Amycolatopsis sp. NPDC024027 TaxID=3154327 RepID=UPI0033FF75FF
MPVQQAANFARVADCLAAIGWLCAAAGPVAVATHAYGRRIEAEHGLECLRTAVAAADTVRDVETIVDWLTKYRGMPDPGRVAARRRAGSRW